MINLAPLVTFLKIVSLIGLIVTVCMMTAVVYQKIKFYYPDVAEKRKFLFILAAALMSLILTFLFVEFLGNDNKGEGVLLR